MGEREAGFAGGKTREIKQSPSFELLLTHECDAPLTTKWTALKFGTFEVEDAVSAVSEIELQSSLH